MTRISEDVRNLYFHWLYDQSCAVRDIDSYYSYAMVCNMMHKIPFNDRVPNDSNRSAQGEELRDEFISTLRKIEIDDYTAVYGLGKASLFEVLVVMTRLCEFNTGLDVQKWFNMFLANLRLHRYSDAEWLPRNDSRVLRILHTMNDRTYKSSGVGGLFPLRHPDRDQRNLELVVQMADYIRENKL